MTADDFERVLAADVSKILDHPDRLSFLYSLGMQDATPGEGEHASVLAHCIDTFVDRNQEYDDLWKEGGSPDSLNHMKHKLARCERARSPHTRVVSALDLINYAVFFIRNTVDESLAEEGSDAPTA